jgi:hypothetical protein
MASFEALENLAGVLICDAIFFMASITCVSEASVVVLNLNRFPDAVAFSAAPSVSYNGTFSFYRANNRINKIKLLFERMC